MEISVTMLYSWRLIYWICQSVKSEIPALFKQKDSFCLSAVSTWKSQLECWNNSRWSRSHPMTQSTTQTNATCWWRHHGSLWGVLCRLPDASALASIRLLGPVQLLYNPRKMCSHVTSQHLNLWKNQCSIMSINRTDRLNLCTLHQLGYWCQG